MSAYAERIARHPLVKGRCPSCHGQSLFLGEGGYVTCSYLSCPDPSVANRWLLTGGENSPSSVTSPATDHEWAEDRTVPYCRRCGNVRRADGGNRPCAGKTPRITTRPTPTPTEKPCERCGGGGIEGDESDCFGVGTDICGGCHGSGVTPTEKAGELSEKRIQTLGSPSSGEQR